MASITVYGSNKMSIRCCDSRKSILISETGSDDPTNHIRIFVNEDHLPQWFAALGEIAARYALKTLPGIPKNEDSQ